MHNFTFRITRTAASIVKMLLERSCDVVHHFFVLFLLGPLFVRSGCGSAFDAKRYRSRAIEGECLESVGEKSPLNSIKPRFRDRSRVKGG